MCESDDEVYADNLSNVNNEVSGNSDEELICNRAYKKCRWQPIVFDIICRWQEQTFF